MKAASPISVTKKFLVVSQSDVHIDFDFARPFLRTRSGVQIKLRLRKIELAEVDLSSPAFQDTELYIINNKSCTKIC